MVRAIREAEIAGMGVFYRVDDSLNKGIAKLESLAKRKDVDWEMPTLGQIARARTTKTPRHSLSRFGSFVKQGTLYVPGENTRILPISLCLSDPEKAVQAHREGREFGAKDGDLTQEQIEKARSEGYEIKKKDLNEEGNLVLDTNSFGSNANAIELFGEGETDEGRSKSAQAVGEWLRGSPGKLEAVIVYLDNAGYVKQVRRAYANLLWLGSLGVGSVVGGNLLYLGYDGVRGMFPATGEARARLVSQSGTKSELLGYSPQEAAQMSAIVKEVIAGRGGISTLKQVRTYLEKQSRILSN